jgi:uncharacterized protein (DUF58 family)
MMTREIAARLKKIQSLTRRRVTSVFSGEYSSAYRGQGIEFEEVRPYTPGDEIRQIDWNVTARTGTPHIKRYREERELRVWLLFDLSASFFYGTTGRSKKEVAAEIASVLAYTACFNHDRIGLILFSDRVEFCLPPLKGLRHTTRLVSEMLTREPRSRGTSLRTALEYLSRIEKRRGMVFVISDFIDTDYRKNLAALASKQDLLAVCLRDPGESSLPGAGLINFADLESGETGIIDTDSRSTLAGWKKHSADLDQELAAVFRKAGVDHILLRTDRDWIHELSRFFLIRMKTRRRGTGVSGL